VLVPTAGAGAAAGPADALPGWFVALAPAALACLAARALCRKLVVGWWLAPGPVAKAAAAWANELDPANATPTDAKKKKAE